MQTWGVALRSTEAPSIRPPCADAVTRMWRVVTFQRMSRRGLTVLAADERHGEARCARDDGTARSRSWRYADLRRPSIFKSTEYFRYTRQRADRAGIRDEWIELAIQQPLAEVVQGDGRTRRWVYIPEEQRYLRVILLADGETVHNAFFDRRFRP